MKNVPYPENHRKFIIVSVIFIVFLITLAFINETQFANLSEISKCAASSPLINYSLPIKSSEDEIRILLGIPTRADNYQRRHFLRLIYGTQSVEGAKVDVKFVFCNLTKEDQRILIALEIMLHNDIIILNCKENMDNGKTYTYFSSLPDMLKNNDSDSTNPPYHYVMKGDDDTYFRLPKLVETLRPLSREDLYYGYVVPCPSMDPFVNYMSGMGYLVSWDIVEWIKESDIPKNHMVGPEDKVFGEWMRDGRRAKNRYNAKWHMYDLPEPPTRCAHELWPETVGVHRLKNQDKWIRTLQYFNATRDLKPSKLYHIP
uniref:beta-1,3-galactosyltransferase pvg3-like n=1 Tax=Erigeron canadensis TaxID=72917 RepID=UPI001CB88F7F|nr:beta-1,3-galactosyltransferase pvg3-like [Erigeron canadensis]